MATDSGMSKLEWPVNKCTTYIRYVCKDKWHPITTRSIDFFKNSVLFQTKLPVWTPSSSSMSEPLPASRQLSTASSLDEILSSSPTGRSEAQTDNVLAPKVTTEKFFHPTKDPFCYEGGSRSSVIGVILG